MPSVSKRTVSPTPQQEIPDLSELLNALYALREQVAANTKRLITLEQTVSVIASERHPTPQVALATDAQNPVVKKLLNQIADLTNTTKSLQSQIDLLTQTHSIELATLSSRYNTLDYLLATDPYKITKAKLIKIAKELKL